MNIAEWTRHPAVQVKSNVFVHDTGAGRVLVKYPTGPGTIFGKIRRIFDRADLALNNEGMIYSSLVNQVQNNGVTPPLVEFKPNAYLVLKFLEGVERLPSYDSFTDSCNHRSQIVNVLVWFNNLKPDVQRSIFQEVSFRLSRAPIWQALKTAVTSRQIRKRTGLSGVLKLVSTLLLLTIRGRPRNMEVLIHNDLHPGNVVVDAEGNFYLLDFEASIVERRWALIDIVRVAFDPVEIIMHGDMVRSYIKKAVATGMLPEEFDHREQIRFALLHRVLGRITSPSRKVTEEERSALSKFMTDVLLEAPHFKEWLRHQGL